MDEIAVCYVKCIFVIVLEEQIDSCSSIGAHCYDRRSGISGIAMLRALLVATLLLLSACAHTPRIPRDQMEIRQGLLQLDIRQQAFLDEWGKPDRTSVTSGEEITAAGLNAYRGFFFKGKLTYEVWNYESRKTSLVFGKKRLVAWQTEETVQDLAAPGN